MFTDKTIIQLLYSHKLFSILNAKTLKSIVENEKCKIAEFKGNDPILKDESVPALYFILSGTVLVHRKGGGVPVLLQRLQAGQLFGAASLFSESDTVTDLTCGESASVLVIHRDIVEDLIRTEPEFAVSYAKFLTEKIRFLNSRINELSAPTVEQKLAAFLLRGESDIAVNRSKLASALGIGRASLYRVLDDLESKGLIAMDGKTIVIKDREKLSVIV